MFLFLTWFHPKTTTEKSSYERKMKKIKDLESEYFRTFVEW